MLTYSAQPQPPPNPPPPLPLPLHSPSAPQFRTEGAFIRYFYDVKPLCTGATPYTAPLGPGNIQYQICGAANVDCVPDGYRVTYNRGNAVQFIDTKVPANKTCTTNAGVAQPCTANCEVIATGPPIITRAWPGRGVASLSMTRVTVYAHPVLLFCGPACVPPPLHTTTLPPLPSLSCSGGPQPARERH